MSATTYRGVVRARSERHEGTVRIQSKRKFSDGTPNWSKDHSCTVVSLEEECQVALSIDVNRLIQVLGLRAAKNKTGKAAALAGLVKVQVVARKVIAESRRDQPIPEYAEKAA